jgi:hypothetical protein
MELGLSASVLASPASVYPNVDWGHGWQASHSPHKDICSDSWHLRPGKCLAHFAGLVSFEPERTALSLFSRRNMD